MMTQLARWVKLSGLSVVSFIFIQSVLLFMKLKLCDEIFTPIWVYKLQIVALIFLTEI